MTIREGKADFPPGGAEASRGQREPAEGGFSPLFLSHPFGGSPTPTRRPPQRTPRGSPLPAAGAPRRVCANLCVSAPVHVQFRGTRGVAPALPRQGARPTGKVSTRRRGPGRAEGQASPVAHAHAAATSAPAGTETESGRSSARSWSLPSRLLGPPWSARSTRVPVTRAGEAPEQGAGPRGETRRPQKSRGSRAAPEPALGQVGFGPSGQLLGFGRLCADGASGQ